MVAELAAGDPVFIWLHRFDYENQIVKGSNQFTMKCATCPFWDVEVFGLAVESGSKYPTLSKDEPFARNERKRSLNTFLLIMGLIALLYFLWGDQLEDAD